MKDEPIYDILKRDHEAVQAILDELDETEGEADRMTLLERLEGDLLPHMHGEESVFYAVLREDDDTREIALDAKEEHRAATHVIRELQRLSPSNELWKARFHVLKKNIEHHVREEEGKMFKKAKKVLDREQAIEIGKQFLAAKREFTAEQDSVPKTG
ncbi:hemerythrin domain-containing protein [Enhygromyxa salina]|uniref:DNA nickase n=1 Tax=Enhygromyxa salina TaxID=215803 RepID=A0A2S9XWV7_9BACT|nr:hemerythrin domain-containing protein [Enhygromyxa salina]PRP97349.1 DNA nickase [Enhygromyxa salina]